MRRRQWTEETLALACTLRRGGASYRAIAAAVGMGATAVAGATRCLRPGAPGRPRKNVDDVRCGHIGHKRIAVSPEAMESAARLLEARRARDDRALGRGDVTPVFFGDPPPGYSALDRKRNAGARIWSR